MSVLIDPEISVKRNLLKLIQSTNPDFNFATINHFVVKDGGVLNPTETVTVGGKSVVLDTWVKIQGVTIWGVEGEHTFKYKRCDISVLKDYGALFGCWDYDATIWKTLATRTSSPAIEVYSIAGLNTVINNTANFPWMTGSRLPITAAKVLNKYFINTPPIKISGVDAVIGNFMNFAWNVKASPNSAADGYLSGGANNSVILDTVSRQIYADKPTKYLASYLNLHPDGLLDERCLAYAAITDMPPILAVKIGEDDTWFKNGAETSKFLYKSTLVVYTNYTDGSVRGYGSNLDTLVTQASLDALRQ